MWKKKSLIPSIEYSAECKRFHASYQCENGFRGNAIVLAQDAEAAVARVKRHLGEVTELTVTVEGTPDASKETE